MDHGVSRNYLEAGGNRYALPTRMIDIRSLTVTSMQWHQDHLWLACADKSMVVVYDPVHESCDEVLSLPGVRHVCPSREGLWLIAGGGRLGQQLLLWSPETNRLLRRFDCPDGAASGVTVVNGKLWLSHRRNRKLFCLDPEKGRNLWTIRMDHQVLSPTSYGDEFWCVECDPGPLGDWSDERQAAYAFLRYDPAREQVVERIPVSFRPACLALNGAQFWYALDDEAGVRSQARPAS